MGKNGKIKAPKIEQKLKKEEIKEVKKKYVEHKKWEKNDERNKWLQYALDIGGQDFVLTIFAENGTMKIDRKSMMVGSNGYSDYGLCQINVGFHPEILNNGKNGKRFKDWFYDPYKQLDYCNKLFKNGVVFYGYSVRHKSLEKLNFYEK